MRTWDYFYPDVLPEVMGCPEPTVDRALLRSAQEWFEKTRAWRVTMSAITTVADQQQYALNLPQHTILERLEAATLNAQDIEVDTVLNSTPEDIASNSNGCKRVIANSNTTVLLLPAQAAGLPLVIVGDVRPSDDAINTGISDNSMASDYSEQIARGAVYRLLSLSDQPWTNPTKAAVARAEFTAAIAREKSRLWRSRSSNRPRAAYQFF